MARNAIKIDYDFGADLKDAIAMFGEDVVFDKFRQKATTEAKSIVNTAVKAGKNPSQAAEALSTWSPHVGRQKKSAAEKYATQFLKLSPEEQADTLAGLQALADAR